MGKVSITNLKLKFPCITATVSKLSSESFLLWQRGGARNDIVL